MASRPDSIPVDKVETLLCCSICLERLDDPRTLPCFHSYCKHCLETFVAKLRKKAAKAEKKIEEFECPSCRSLFCLKENEEVANMRGSHFIRNMVEVLNAESGTNVWRCSNHNEKASCCRCVTCEAFLCEGCFAAHDNWPAFKDHSVLTIEELKKPENQSKIKDQMRCKEHKDKKLKFYCENCQVLICRYCMDFNHVKPEHLCHPIEAAEKHREALQSCCNTLDKEREKAEQSLKVVADAEKVLKNTAENAKKEISKQKNDIVKAVEDIFHSKINEVEKLYAKFEGQLSGQRGKIDSFLDMVKCAGSMSKNLLEKGSNEEIMESQKMVEERVETVKIESQNVDNLPNPVLVDRNWFKTKQVMIGKLSTIFGEVTYNEFENSSILKQDDYDQQIIEWFGNEGWQLCYRATTDAWSSKNVHSKCDIRGPTLTFVKVDDNIFGGYIGVDGKDINRCNTKEAFMFSIQNNDKLTPFKANEKAISESQSGLVSDGKKQEDNKTTTSAQARTNQQVSKTGECGERPASNREQHYKTNRNFSKSDFGDARVEKRHEPETYCDNRQKQDLKFNDKRARPREDARHEQTKRNYERKAAINSSSDKLVNEPYSKEKERKDGQGSESRFEARRGQNEHPDGTRQSDRTQERVERVDRRDNTAYRGRKEQGDQVNLEQRNRSEHQRPDLRDRSGRPDRPEQRERTDRRDRTKQREQTDYRDTTEPQSESKSETVKSTDDTRGKPDDNDEKNKNTQHNVPDKESANRSGKENEKSAKTFDDLSSSKKQPDRFNVGYMNPREDRRPYSDSCRGGPSSRRGARGGLRGIRGRGRGRPIASGRPVGKGSVASKDDENDSDDYLSADSRVTSELDESDSEEVFKKENDRQKDETRRTPSYPSSGRARPSYSSRGRGRGNSQSQRNQQKLPQKPPRFPRQEQVKNTGRGRGKGTRGGLSFKENWDDASSKNKDGRTSDEGPSPKKRPPDSSFANEKTSDGVLRGQKSSRGGHSANKNSFLAKKQQEVEGSSRKGGARFGAKSTVPAALTTHGRNERRAKNEPSSADVDENLESPKKNARRTEPTKLGIEHIDMSNIAGFIDIDDIVHPANEVEPYSPQTDFFEVKSKRTQKELREKQREEEERKRRETEKMIQDALLKPKSNKPTSVNKQHTASKPPRFARNTGATSSAISTLPGGNTPPRGATQKMMQDALLKPKTNKSTSMKYFNTDKNSSVETDKRQSSGNNWKSDHTPRFESGVE